jgi:hypothetical protein
MLLVSSMVICFVTLFTLPSSAAFFALSFQRSYAMGQSLIYDSAEKVSF